MVRQSGSHQLTLDLSRCKWTLTEIFILENRMHTRTMYGIYALFDLYSMQENPYVKTLKFVNHGTIRYSTRFQEAVNDMFSLVAFIH